MDNNNISLDKSDSTTVLSSNSQDTLVNPTLQTGYADQSAYNTQQTYGTQSYDSQQTYNTQSYDSQSSYNTQQSYAQQNYGTQQTQSSYNTQSYDNQSGYNTQQSYTQQNYGAQPNYTQSTYTAPPIYINNSSNDIPSEYKPLGPWAYFGYMWLFSIPCVGFIVLLVFALGGAKNINLRNFARSYFCMILLIVILYAILLIIGLATGIGSEILYEMQYM